MKTGSLQAKVVSLIVALMLVVMAVVIPLTVVRQKNDLLEAAKSTLAINTDMLNIVIKNLMLGGEAPIAVDTLLGLQQIGEFRAIDLYRTNGDRAFQDYRTLEFVNSYQERIVFEPTPRVEEIMLSNPAFAEVIESGRPVIREMTDAREMEYFFPLRNEQACQLCHGSVEVSGPLRGIAHFKISIEGIYRQIGNASILLVAVIGVSIVLFGTVLIGFLRRLVLRPLLHIGRTVDSFGAGSLDSQVSVDSRDELGTLAGHINTMFESVRERLRLSKYVSRSTDAMIRQRESVAAGERSNLTVLFSDVRGFTRFADKADAAAVIERLNRLLDVQAGIIDRHGGDIDKFMGDAVMALFDEPIAAVRAAIEMVKETYLLNKEYAQRLEIGVGINFGEVVAGNIGSENRQEYAVIGDTVNLASRLCGLAPPNSVLISESLYTRLSSVLEVTAVKDQIIKGKSLPITYYALKRIKEGPSA